MLPYRTGVLLLLATLAVAGFGPVFGPLCSMEMHGAVTESVHAAGVSHEEARPCCHGGCASHDATPGITAQEAPATVRCCLPGMVAPATIQAVQDAPSQIRGPLVVLRDEADVRRGQRLSTPLPVLTKPPGAVRSHLAHAVLLI